MAYIRYMLLEKQHCSRVGLIPRKSSLVGNQVKADIHSINTEELSECSLKGYIYLSATGVRNR